MLDADGQVVHGHSHSHRRDRSSRRDSSSTGRGSSRRISLQEWILGSLPALPAMPYSSRRDGPDEANALLLDNPLQQQSGGMYGSVLLEGDASLGGKDGNRVRRSLDHSFKRSTKSHDSANRRSSMTAVVSSNGSKKNLLDINVPPKKPKPAEVQYESFKDLTRQKYVIAIVHRFRHFNMQAIKKRLTFL
jgi:hypothetical protein